MIHGYKHVAIYRWIVNYIKICSLFDCFGEHQEEEYKKQYFQLNLDRLDDYWHRAAVMTLLKAKAKYLLSTELPFVEKFIYKKCEEEAKTPVSLAKCVVSLINARYRIEEPEKDFKPWGLNFREVFRTGKLLSATRTYRPLDAPIKPVNMSSLELNQKRKESVKFKSTSEEKLEGLDARKYKTNHEKVLVSSTKYARNFFDKPIPAREIYENIQNEGSLRKKPPKNWLIEKINKNIVLANESTTYRDLARRKKRMTVSFEKHNPNSSTKWKNLENLKKVQKYMKMVKYCSAYMKKISAANSNFLKSTKFPVQYETSNVKNLTILEEVLNLINQFTGSKSQKFSFLSPRIMSILPSKSRKSQILSPDLLSFHRDGLFSWPEIFQTMTGEQLEHSEWIDLLMDLSGASKALESAIQHLEPDIKYMKEEMYPAVLELEKMEQNWELVQNNYTPEQKQALKKYGYTFLEPNQIPLIYSGRYAPKLELNYADYANMSPEEREKRLESDIRKLAKLENNAGLKWPPNFTYQNNRVKRESQNETIDDEDSNDVFSSGHVHHGFHTLGPGAFTAKIGQGVALEVITLSPYAFYTEILFPEALIVNTLSPRAFVPSILSPGALISRILSPGAFRAEILSPRALQAWVLSPEALIAEVLSPKFLEAKILSPNALMFEVLSPSILKARVMSPEGYSFFVLNPGILSPRIMSEHIMIVEVLSPHILGGGDTSHEEEEEEHKESGHHRMINSWRST
uniref:Uncharacterized protein n=1 Tax=Acrobeloides nanus TaxID=290746 RepID=A0A914DFL3_9BILA